MAKIEVFTSKLRPVSPQAGLSKPETGTRLASIKAYTSTLFDIVEKLLPSVHCYDDDSQLYLAFSPGVAGYV